MKRQKPVSRNRDPQPYDGPIARADGLRPFNRYLLHTEFYCAGHEAIHRHIHTRWFFGIVALLDGRFSIEGSVWAIEKNDYCGKPVVFATRAEAIRTGAARMIRRARRSGNWDYQFGGLKGKYLAEVINWALAVVARETSKPEPKPVQVKEPPPEYRKTGLPLLDYIYGGKNR